MEIMRRTPWSRIREQNSVYKEFLEIVGNWETNGQCVKGDNCSFRHDIDKYGKVTPSNPSPNSFMQRKSSRTRSPREKVPVVECLDGLARITSKELATTHFVKDGTLQNACSTRPRAVVGLGKSAHMHIVRLMNSRLKGPKRMMTKVQCLFRRNVTGMKEDPLPTNVTIDQGNLIRGVIRSWDEDHLNVDNRTHDNWVVSFKT